MSGGLNMVNVGLRFLEMEGYYLKDTGVIAKIKAFPTEESEERG